MAASELDLELSDIVKVFHLPLIEAAARFGLAPVSLKKICRLKGVMKWPYRQLCSLDNMIQALETASETIFDPQFTEFIADMERKRALIHSNPVIHYSISNERRIFRAISKRHGLNRSVASDKEKKQRRPRRTPSRQIEDQLRVRKYQSKSTGSILPNDRHSYILKFKVGQSGHDSVSSSSSVASSSSIPSSSSSSSFPPSTIHPALLVQPSDLKSVPLTVSRPQVLGITSSSVPSSSSVNPLPSVLYYPSTSGSSYPQSSYSAGTLLKQLPPSRNPILLMNQGSEKDQTTTQLNLHPTLSTSQLFPSGAPPLSYHTASMSPHPSELLPLKYPHQAITTSPPSTRTSSSSISSIVNDESRNPRLTRSVPTYSNQSSQSSPVQPIPNTLLYSDPPSSPCSISSLVRPSNSMSQHPSNISFSSSSLQYATLRCSPIHSSSSPQPVPSSDVQPSQIESDSRLQLPPIRDLEKRGSNSNLGTMEPPILLTKSSKSEQNTSN